MHFKSTLLKVMQNNKILLVFDVININFSMHSLKCRKANCSLGTLCYDNRTSFFSDDSTAIHAKASLHIT